MKLWIIGTNDAILETDMTILVSKVAKRAFKEISRTDPESGIVSRLTISPTRAPIFASSLVIVIVVVIDYWPSGF